MGTIRNLANRVSLAAQQWETTKQVAIRETAPQTFPQLNREQLRKGQLSDGNPISPPLANITYALDKENKNGANGRSLLTPNLFDTGAFQGSITTTVTRLSIKTFSLDLKAPKLQLKYSPLIYGLQPNNLTKYATETLKPVLFEKFRSQTVG